MRDSSCWNPTRPRTSACVSASPKSRPAIRRSSTTWRAERAAVRAHVFLDDALAQALEQWIRDHYRDRLSPADLADPALLAESRRALDRLSQLLQIGSVYPFQR